MRNIPTDLLRAFVTIIDLRGYTRAGEQLGRTQPAISLQMKRLQDLMGVQLFAKEGSLQLTENGEFVASCARQILAINDDMVLKVSARSAQGKLRLGIPNDYADHFLPMLISSLDKRPPEMTFEVICDLSHNLLQGLRNGLFDIVLALTPEGPAEGAFMTWKESLSWVSGLNNQASVGNENLRIVCYPEGCLYRRQMLTALQREGRRFDIVYTSGSFSGLAAAVGAGYGITVLARRIVSPKFKEIVPGKHLPQLANVMVGIYVNSDRKRSAVAQSFAAHFADIFLAGSSKI